MSHLRRTSRPYAEVPALQPPAMQTIIEENDQSPGIAPDEPAPERENAPVVPPPRQSHLSVETPSEHSSSSSSISVALPKHDSLFSNFTFTFGRSKRTSAQSSPPTDQNSRRRTLGSLRDSIVEAGKHLIPRKRKRDYDDEGRAAQKSFVVTGRPPMHCQRCRCHPVHQAADVEAEAECEAREVREREAAEQNRGRQQLRVVRPVVPARAPSPAPSLKWAGDEVDFFCRIVLAADGQAFVAGLS